MEENKEGQIIYIKQLPIIKATLENLSIEIKEKVDRANNLIVNDNTIKEVKQVRASLNKEFNELETQRKQVKQAIMSKYDEFEELYKENVSNLYKQADATLKEKIDSVENQLKQEKEDELRAFVKRHCEVNNVHIDFEIIGLNISLSASMKSLKEQAKAFIEKVASDLKLIELEEYSSEILYEYNQSFDFTSSKIKVIERHKQIEEIQKQQEIKQEQEKQEEKIIEKVDEIVAPVEVIEDEDIIEVAFKVKGTKSQIKQIKDLIIQLGVEYE